MDFHVEVIKLPDKNTTVINITTKKGKTFSTVITNRDYEDDTNAIISQTIFKLVCMSMKDFVKEVAKEKMEEKGYEIIKKSGRPKSKETKRKITEEQREK
jgi:hypothetical protein